MRFLTLIPLEHISHPAKLVFNSIIFLPSLRWPLRPRLFLKGGQHSCEGFAVPTPSIYFYLGFIFVLHCGYFHLHYSCYRVFLVDTCIAHDYVYFLTTFFWCQ
ncbi:MAG: hypothetical protein EZS28_040577 [Streblomastix strix]|uniref:Uncharacterized protein n=1 Tax=Streblomastix strix TaxID=222440 RepID=A0A5J4TZM7_9EUKA|nr:MAG: hypothetical protein EZS28_040577 [Streblomastix strix]